MRQNEYGETLYVATNVDITSASNIQLFLTRPYKELIKTTPEVVIGASNITVDGVDYVAGFYITYVIEENDIDQFGDYKVRLELDLGSIHYISSTDCFVVDKEEGACPCP